MITSITGTEDQLHGFLPGRSAFLTQQPIDEYVPEENRPDQCAKQQSPGDPFQPAARWYNLPCSEYRHDYTANDNDFYPRTHGDPGLIDWFQIFLFLFRFILFAHA
ncbi:MAG: hypothetical protein ACYC3P_03110 [Bellilinea sp.]